MTRNDIETAVVKPNLTFVEKDKEYSILESDQEKALEIAVFDVTEYVERNDGYGKTKEEKDNLYASAQEYWKHLADTLRETKFNLFLNKDQYKFIVDVLKNKVEYDSNTVFFAMEIAELLSTKEVWTDAEAQKPFKVNATEITYVYHIISKYKVKGLNKEAYLFVDILKRIGQMSKIINYYDAGAKALSNKIVQWVSEFEDAPKFDDTPETATTLQA